MSRSRDLRQHIAQLDEIRAILNAMKNLAYMETHKLEQYLGRQNQVVKHIETVAGDFLSYYPYPDNPVDNPIRVCLVIGSERGFCGDFNKLLLTEIDSESYDELIIVGRKLNTAQQLNSQSITFINGPNIAEEVQAILNRLISAIDLLLKQHQAIILTVIHHDFTTNRIVVRQLIPPFRNIAQNKPIDSHPPILNLQPKVFLSELIDHFLFAVLHQIFYNSLMVENHRRMQHMEGATQHLDETSENLKGKANIFRQEEITEEIEVILLTAENLR